MFSNQPLLTFVLFACCVLTVGSFGSTAVAQSDAKDKPAAETKEKPAVELPPEVSQSQKGWYDHYKSQKNITAPADMLLNTDSEPELTDGFESLFNGTDLTGWTPQGGGSKFEVVDGMIKGVCVPGENSTYLCTDRDDYSDFIFTCDMKWEVDGNTGVMFRAKLKDNPKAKNKNAAKIVYGPQLELEEAEKGRYWSGGIYGQSCGGYFYPVWLKKHQEARSAMQGRLEPSHD